MRDKDKRKQRRPNRERKRKGRPRKICQHMNCGSDAVTSLRSIAFNLYKSELSVPSIQISIGKTKQTLIIEQYYRWKKEEEKKDNEARNKDQDDTKSIGPFISLVFFFYFVC